MLELKITGNTPEEIREALLGMLNIVGGSKAQEEKPVPVAEEKPAKKEKPVKAEKAAPVEEEKPAEKPVITPEQAEENVKNAPEHVEPEQPSLEEVRAALKELRDRKGSDAVKELLKAFGADNLPSLKPENYLGALARAKTEV